MRGRSAEQSPTLIFLNLMSTELLNEFYPCWRIMIRRTFSLTGAVWHLSWTSGIFRKLLTSGELPIVLKDLP